MRRKRELSPAFGAMEATLKTYDLAKALRPHLAKVHWEKIVGPQVAGVTQVESVWSDPTTGESILVVRVKNSVWANELTLLKGDMLRRLNLAIGGKVLSDIRFKASGLSRSKKKPKVEKQTETETIKLESIDLPSETLLRIEQSVQHISDELLRSKVRTTLLHSAQVTLWQKEHHWAPCERCGALTPKPNSEGNSPSKTPLLCDVCTAIWERGYREGAPSKL